MEGRGIKFVEGWLEHKTNQTKWRRYWCVLKGQTIFIFTTNERTAENHVGTLTIDSNANVTVGEGDPKNGYKFSLQTKGRLNKFKTKLMSERELWRGYIAALAKDRVPEDLDLLPAQREDIRARVAAYWRSDPVTPTTPLTPSTISPASSDRFFPPSPNDPRSPQTPLSPSPQTPLSPLSPVYPGSDSASISSGFSDPDCQGAASGGSRADLSMGGPIMRHKFWNDMRNTTIPTWFYADCTRQDAEMVLKKCAKYGNTLMRESFTFRQTGSYVISKCLNVDRDEFNHFEVKRVAEGFKINVENPHNAMSCLSEVMDFFVNLCGRATTIPLTCSDPDVLDLTSPYMSRINPAGKTNEESGEEELESTPPRTRKVSFSDELPAPPPAPHIPPPAPHFPPAAVQPPPLAPQIPSPQVFPPASPSAEVATSSGHKTWAGRASERQRIAQSQNLMKDLQEKLRKGGKTESKEDNSCDGEDYLEPAAPIRDGASQQVRPPSAEADDAVRALDSTIDLYDQSDSSQSAGGEPYGDIYEPLPDLQGDDEGTPDYVNQNPPALPRRSKDDPLPPPPSKQSLKRWETRSKSVPNIDTADLLRMKVEIPKNPVGLVKPSQLKKVETDPTFPTPPSPHSGSSTPTTPFGKQAPTVKPKPLRPVSEMPTNENDVSVARRQLKPVSRPVTEFQATGSASPSSTSPRDEYYTNAASATDSSSGGVVEEVLPFKEKLKRIQQSMEEASVSPSNRNSQMLDSIYQN